MRTTLFPAAIAALIASVSLAAEVSIEPGEVWSGDFDLGEDGAWFGIELPGRGILTAYADGTGDGGDLTLAVYGPDYREPLLEYSDMDMDGDYARESITVQIPRSGRYYVKVGAYSGSTTPFDLVTSFALYGQDLPGDPDGVSASARPVSLGDCRAPGGFRDMLDGAAGDYRDWFRFQPEESGLLLVSVIADTGGDLILSAHGSDDPLESELARSDSDYDGNYGNERVVVDCEPGHPILIQVQGYGTYVADQYTLRLSFMPIESDARSGER